MIDMEGNAVHCVGSNSSSMYFYLLENGNFVTAGSVSAAGDADTYGLLSAGGSNGLIEELDWDGNVVWSMDAYSEDYRQHHDFRKIWNKSLQEYTFIFIVWERLGAEDAVALGADVQYASDYEGGWSPCGIYEVNQNKEIIWRWSFADHLVQNYDETKTAAFTDAAGRTNPGATYGEPANYPGKLDINWETVYGGPQPDWTHCNSLDFNADLGHVVINAKHMSEFYVIDHDGTFVSTTDWDANIAAASSDAGDFLYRFGNPSVYDQGEAPGYHNAG